MLLAFIASLALLLPSSAQTTESANAALVAAARPDPRASRQRPSPHFDLTSEGELLRLTNQERQRAGERPLALDATLTAAARTHALAMAERRQLSHQLPGEPPLDRRIASSSLHLLHAGENVALDVDLAQAHDALMHSSGHRENLLRADYNIVGFGIARVGEQLYLVEDFAESVPPVSPAQAEDAVAVAIRRQRPLKRLEIGALRRAACSMASADQINAKQVAAAGKMRYVLAYSNGLPESLPRDAARPLGDGKLRSFAVGSCYARTPTYPNGAYFIALAFY